MSQQELEDQIVDGCHHTRSVAFSQMTPVLAQGLIASVMRAILDAPMSPFDIQHPFGIRFACCQTAYAIGDVVSDLAIGDTGDMALQAVDLLPKRPINVALSFSTGRQCAPLNAAMPFLDTFYRAQVLPCGSETRDA